MIRLEPSDFEEPRLARLAAQTTLDSAAFLGSPRDRSVSWEELRGRDLEHGDGSRPDEQPMTGHLRPRSSLIGVPRTVSPGLAAETVTRSGGISDCGRA